MHTALSHLHYLLSVRYTHITRVPTIRRFEGKLSQIFEHFNAVLRGIPSRMRAENFKVRTRECVVPCTCAHVSASLREFLVSGHN